MQRSGGAASVLAVFASLQWPWLLVLFLICLANNIVAACRFFLLVRRAASRPLGFWEVMKVNAAALFLGYWTPVSIAGDGARVLWLRNSVVGTYRDAVMLVLWDRLIALAALVAFMIPFVPWYAERIGEYFGIDGNAILAVAAGGVVLAAFFAYSRRGRLGLPVAAGKLATGTNAWLHALIGFLYVGTFFLAMLCAAASLGLARHWPQLLIAAPALFLAQNVPITYGGLGSRELAFLVIVGPVAGDAGAITMSLVVGLGFLMAALPGGAALAEFRGRDRVA